MTTEYPTPLVEVNPDSGIVQAFHEMKEKLDLLDAEAGVYARTILKLTIENDELRLRVQALESENQLLKS